MDIEEQDSLYQMTAQGKKWWGDLSKQDLKEDHMEPFGTGSIERQVGSVFSDHDQFILRTLFYPFSVRFGYIEENLEQFKTNLRKISWDYLKNSIERNSSLEPNQITFENLTWVRPGIGIPPGNEKSIIGRELVNSLEVGQIITLKDFHNK